MVGRTETNRVENTTPSDEKHFLVIDIDNCTFVFSSELPELLSETLLTHVKMKHYDGFYVCTHRSRLNLMIDENYDTALEQEKDLKRFSVKNITLEKRHFYLSQITKNFAEKSGLKLMAVSTPDDDSEAAPSEPINRCGFGYNNIIEPYENDLLNNVTNEPYENLFLPHVLEPDLDSKNQQLILISEHAVAMHPEATTITLHYMDDRMDLLELAKQIPSDQLPASIKANLYHHEDSKEIRLIGTVSAALADEKAGTTSLSQNRFTLSNKKRATPLEETNETETEEQPTHNKKCRHS